MARSSLKRIKRALVSVSDKSRITELVRYLTKNNVEVLSTGGTAKLLKRKGIQVTQISDYTQFPEIMGGRVKTLHPKIHGALLRREKHPEDARTMKKHNILPVDLVVTNLYPFEASIASGKDYQTCIENIDIGGPTMIRSAAKNHSLISIIVDPGDYGQLINEMKKHKGKTSIAYRKALAAKAFRYTAYYDSIIAGWFNRQIGEQLPEKLVIPGELSEKLRYGENPHQNAAYYHVNLNWSHGVYKAQLQGKELSYNNLSDTDAAFGLVSEFHQKACVIVKHANPCGVATSNSIKRAYTYSLACDPESAFGGVIALNDTLDAATAKEITKTYVEVIIAPKITVTAQKILAQKKSVRVLEAEDFSNYNAAGLNFKSLSGGLLIQENDSQNIGQKIKTVTKRKPSEAEMNDLLFAFTVCKHVKSNAIVYAKNGVTVGIGAGQMSRVNSSRIASWKAEDASIAAGEKKSRAIGSVVASDAFFPFADGLIAAADAGVTAIIQPGGSIRDEEVIEAANEKEIAMVFTGVRHFRH